MQKNKVTIISQFLCEPLTRGGVLPCLLAYDVRKGRWEVRVDGGGTRKKLDNHGSIYVVEGISKVANGEEGGEVTSLK